MDSQSSQPVAPNQPTNSQPVAPQTRPAVPVSQSTKPKLHLSDSAAQDLLALHNLQAGRQPKTKFPGKLLMIIAALIALAILTTYLVGVVKPGSSSQSPNSDGGLGLPSQSNSSNGNGTSNQINQDVKSCSNLVNAATVC